MVVSRKGFHCLGIKMKCRCCSAPVPRKALYSENGLCSVGCRLRMIERFGERAADQRVELVVSGDPFFRSTEWLRLRYRAFKRYGRRCALCRATRVELHVDHIKPRSKYPELALTLSNLQILCRACNLGKSNDDQTRWRK